MLRLDLAWTEADAAPSRFFLNNGDEISGRIASLSAETVGIESPSLGRISIPRALLSNISLSGFWLESHFETGVLKPWEAVAGSCSFSDGVLRLSGEPPAGLHPAILSLPLRQDKTVTLIADYDPTPPFTPLRIQLFADRAHPQMQIQNGIMLADHPVGLVRRVQRRAADVAAQAAPAHGGAGAAGRVRLKVTYNPADGNAKAWLNGRQVAEVTAPQGPQEGEYVLFGALRPLSIRRLAVYCGLPAPDRPAAGAKAGEILSYLSNGDFVRAREVEFTDGNFVFTTEFGPMKVSPERVISIAFPQKAEKPPAAESAAALVETSGSRFALQMRDDHRRVRHRQEPGPRRSQTPAPRSSRASPSRRRDRALSIPGRTT